MKPRERLLAAINHEEADRLPISPRVIARFLPWLYGSSTWKAQLKAAKDFGYDAYIRIEPPGYVDILLGLYVPRKLPSYYKDVKQEVHETQVGDYILFERIIETPSGKLREKRLIPSEKALKRILEKHKDICPPTWLPEGYPYIKEYLIKDESDLDKVRYLLPDVSAINLKELERIRREVGNDGVIVIEPTCPFTWLVYLLGISKCMYFYFKNKDFLVELLKMLNEQAIAEIERIAEVDVDIVYFSGCYSSLSVGWSLKIWRELFKPIVQEQVKVAHKHSLYYHYYDDGKCSKILPELKECGVDIVSTLVPPPFGDVKLDEVKKLVGDKICLKGNVSIETLRYGTVEQVIKETKKAILSAAEGGGFILSTTDSIHAYTPLENFKAFVETGKKYGRYPLR